MDVGAKIRKKLQIALTPVNAKASVIARFKVGINLTNAIMP